MKKKFTKIGNSWAILFTKTMLELLGVNPENERVEIEFDKNVITIKKENDGSWDTSLIDCTFCIIVIVFSYY